MPNNHVIPFYNVSFKRGDFVLLDTNVVLYLDGYNNNPFLKTQCEELLYQIAAKGAAFAVSDVVHEELYKAFMTDELNQQFKGGSYTASDVKHLCRTQSNLYCQMTQRTSQRHQEVLEFLKSLPVFYSDTARLLRNDSTFCVQSLISKYAIPGYNDAKQIQIALENKIDYFATTDADFNLVKENGLQVITDENTYLKANR